MSQTVTFFSNFSQHVLVRQPERQAPTPDGQGWITTKDPVRYKFQPSVDESGKLVGRLDVTVGQDPMTDLPGWLAHGEKYGETRDAPTALRAHVNFRRDFWEMPVPAAQIRGTIRKASVALDNEGLAALIEQERSTFNRADLLAEAQDALALVEQTRAELQEQQAEAEPDEFKTPTVTPVEASPKPKAKAKPKAEPQS